MPPRTPRESRKSLQRQSGKRGRKMRAIQAVANNRELALVCGVVAAMYIMAGAIGTGFWV